MKVQMCFICDHGKYESEVMEISYEEYIGLTEISKGFYQSNSSFDMWIKDGFFVASPEIVQRSLLIINVLENEG